MDSPSSSLGSRFTSLIPISSRTSHLTEFVGPKNFSACSWASVASRSILSSSSPSASRFDFLPRGSLDSTVLRESHPICSSGNRNGLMSFSSIRSSAPLRSGGIWSRAILRVWLYSGKSSSSFPCWSTNSGSGTHVVLLPSSRVQFPHATL